MALQKSEYITRSGRRVVLRSSERRPIPQAGNEKPVETEIFRGDLYKADGRSIDSEHEWMDTLRQGVLGEHVNSNSATQVASELDLIQHIG
jgi:hypothetical protein